mmetsp:Transcript_10618/g.14612  ORF Transcript_10618/g.14612 Transcript_10618/m.14612 type:complete len:115 (-) Transcript_10618:373-717(-)
MRVTDSLGSHCSTEPESHQPSLLRRWPNIHLMESTSMSRRGLGAHRPSSGPVYRWPGPDPSSEPQGPVASLPRWSQSVSQSLSQHSQPLSAAQTIHGHCSPTLTVGSEDLPLLR